jgi:PTS system fructose-specific IIC component
MPIETTCPGIRVSLADYTRAELVVARLRASDPLGIIEELSHALRLQEVLGDLFSFYHAAVNHEFLSNSALPAGLAIPHARSTQVSRLTMAVGRTAKPVIWGGKGSLPVDLVFLLAVPATAAQDHLSLLSGIAGLANQSEMLRQLRAAPDARGMFELLNVIQLPAG